MSCRESFATPDVGRRAEQLFANGWKCSAAVLASVMEDRGLAAQDMVAMAALLPAGFRPAKGMCGALAGGLLAMGLLHGRGNPGCHVEASGDPGQELLARFLGCFGAMDCSRLLGCDLSNPEGQRLYKERRLAERCKGFTAEAARLVVEVLGEHRRKGSSGRR